MKHKFIEYGVVVVDGELIEQKGIERELTFSLKMKGLELFEKEYGKPLIKALMKLVMNSDIEKIQNLKEDSDIVDIMEVTNGVVDEKFIRSLACASYVKIVDNQAFNNEVTVDELKQSFVYNQMLIDVTFISKLLNMAINAVFETNKKNSNQNKKGKN